MDCVSAKRLQLKCMLLLKRKRKKIVFNIFILYDVIECMKVMELSVLAQYLYDKHCSIVMWPNFHDIYTIKVYNSQGNMAISLGFGGEAPG